MDAPVPADVFLFDAFWFDRRAGALFRRDEDGALDPVAIGSRALAVLSILMARQGGLVSKDDIMQAVWPGMVVEDNNLTVQVSVLRRILDDGRAAGSCIQTIPGRGYRFAVPVTRIESCAQPAPERPSGNGAGGPIGPPPASPNLAAPRNTAIAVPPRKRKWLWCGSLGLIAGAVCLLLVAVSDRRSPQSPSTREAPRLSIVVLPFTDLGDGGDQKVLADGLTEDLTTELSLHPDIRVTSPNTAFSYGNKLDTKQIGRELGVRYALEGSVQRSGNRFRVNAELIDTEMDRHLWAERFDRDTANLFALQNEIAIQLANALGVELIAAEAARPTEHPDAFDYILRGRAARLKPNSRDVYAEAIDFYERALALDPQSVEAQTRLASSLAGRVLDYMTDSPIADIARADELVGRVLATSPRYALAHFVKGQVLRVQRRWPEATHEYENVLAINPNDTDALHALSACKLYTGSIEEVIPLEEQAIGLNPRDPHIGFNYWRIGFVHLLQSRTDGAIFWLEKSTRSEPEFSDTPAVLAAAYALEGETERAATQLTRARSLKNEASSGGFALFVTKMKSGPPQVPKVQALIQATVLAGLHKAGVPEH